MDALQWVVGVFHGLCEDDDVVDAEADAVEYDKVELYDDSPDDEADL